MTSPLKALDDMIAPILIAANKARQVRDSLPPALWQLVPVALRSPINILFEAVEAYDRKVGLMREAGFFPAKHDPG